MNKIIIAALVAALAGCGGGGGGSAVSLVGSGAVQGPQDAASSNAPPAKQYPPCSVDFWGDSISAMVAPRLSPRLEVKLRSLPGGTAAAAQASFLQDPLESRFIVLEFGTNDANSGSLLEPPLRSMLDRAKVLGRRIVLAGIPIQTAGNTAVLANYRLLTGALASEYGTVYADWGAEAGPLMADGVHPADEYQQLLADKLSQLILKECEK